MAGLSQRVAFGLTCWLLGLVAFAELVLVGTAMTLAWRGQQEPEVVEVERVVTQHVPVVREVREVPEAAVEARSKEPEVRDGMDVSLPPRPPIMDREPEPVRLATPPIQDPNVERLVAEARAAHVAGDLVRAITKLEEARKMTPGEPNTLYLLGQCHESMGLYDQAVGFYEQVFEMGTTGAGSLYELAANKIAEGFEQSGGALHQFSLGRPRVFRDQRMVSGERTVLTVPILAAPDVDLSAEEIEQKLHVKVTLYDRRYGDIRPADEQSSFIEHAWITPPVDWLDAGEELLRVTYLIPAQGQAASGNRSYFGYLIELYFENELLDQTAMPRTLAFQKDSAGGGGFDSLPMQDFESFEDYNEAYPLLPTLDE